VRHTGAEPVSGCGTFAPMSGRRFHTRAVSGALAAVAAAGLLAACGDSTNQASGEPSGTYTVAVKSAFPKRQAYAKNQVFQIAVANRSGKDIPNVTATVDGFFNVSTQQGEQDPRDAVWIVNQGPVGGVTALTNTWALGRVPAGGTRTFTWRVTPMQSGRHVLHYRVNASLYGTSKAILADGGPPEGTVGVRVSPRPSKTQVDPKTGEVVVVGTYKNSD